MSLRYTVHATARLAQRGIDPIWVEQTVEAPDWTAPDPDPRLMRSFKAIGIMGNRVLRVVHRPDGAEILIITAHFDRGASP